MTDFHCELAWLSGPRPAADVLIQTRGDRITSVAAGTPRPEHATHLAGLTLPGLANTHSHVFHRALRGRTHGRAADFWAWREQMYPLAERLDPESLYQLALGTYAEMALSGITSVGEFHYLHHQSGGHRYADPNELGRAVVRAAHDAGIRITLLDTCYLQAELTGEPLSGPRRRFDDGTWQGWAARVAELADEPMTRIGAAIHSVRAVPKHALSSVAEFADSRGMPLHVHLSEQPAENAACLSVHGVTPTQLLGAEGALGTATTAVHATHLTDQDVRHLGETGTSISMCCTTERDLADGVGPAAALARAGSPLCVGSDGHSVIDLWEEARAIELDERLVTGVRGHLSVEQLLVALTAAGARSLGWDAGLLAPGKLADLVTLRLDTPRMAGAATGDPLAHAVFAAGAADVSTVVVGGRILVDDGVHTLVERPGTVLADAIATVTEDVESR
ncbi:MAG: formimidoylglutamate deiminase [Actinomycetota bacterium]|nr:formimidoylglutamate deiminase [Actinomycetota bacterium]